MRSLMMVIDLDGMKLNIIVLRFQRAMNQFQTSSHLLIACAKLNHFEKQNKVEDDLTVHLSLYTSDWHTH